MNLFSFFRESFSFSLRDPNELKTFVPKSFADALAIVEALADGETVIVDLRSMDAPLDVQRTFDFVAGCAYGLNRLGYSGHQLQFASDVFGFGNEELLEEYQRSLRLDSIAANTNWEEV